MLGALVDRELGRAGVQKSAGVHAAGPGATPLLPPLQGLWQGLSTDNPSAGVIAVDPAGQPCPPFALAFSKVLHGSKLLAVADEEGWVCIVDAAAPRLPSSLHMDAACAPKAQWLAHQNTIYDVQWAKNDSLLYTAAGDHHVGVWDTHTAALRCYCKGHSGSVKAVVPHTGQPEMLASGARDGTVMLWDLRTPTRWSARRQRNMLAPSLRIDVADGAKAAAAGISGARSTAARTQLRRSVTALAFLPGDSALAAGSDMDGVVRVWDVRMAARGPVGLLPSVPQLAAGAAAATGSSGAAGATAAALGISTPLGRARGTTVNGGSARGTPGSAGRSSGGKGRGNSAGQAQPWLSVTCPHRGRPHGITSLALSPDGGMLLASTSDGAHHLYPTTSLDRPDPWATLSGHRATSFCVKAAFSPDGRAVASGSSDGIVHIWDTARPSAPPKQLRGHNGEVTSVAWCPTDPWQLATASDDATIRVWTLGEGWRAAAADQKAAAEAAAREERRATERAAVATAAAATTAASVGTAATAAATPSPAGTTGGAGGRLRASARALRAAARDAARTGGRQRGGARGLGAVGATTSPATPGSAAATPGSGAAQPRMRQMLITDRLAPAQPAVVDTAAGAAAALVNGAQPAAALQAPARERQPVAAVGGEVRAAAAAGTAATASASLVAGVSPTPPPQLARTSRLAQAGTPMAWEVWHSQGADGEAVAAEATDRDAGHDQPQQQRRRRLWRQGVAGGDYSPECSDQGALPGPSDAPLLLVGSNAPAPAACPRHPFGCRCLGGGDAFVVFEEGASEDVAAPGAGDVGTRVGRRSDGFRADQEPAGVAAGGGGGLQRALSFNTSLVEASAPQAGDEETQGNQAHTGGTAAAAAAAAAAVESAAAAEPALVAAAAGGLSAMAPFGFPRVTRSGSPSRESWPSAPAGPHAHADADVNALDQQQEQQQQGLGQRGAAAASGDENIPLPGLLPPPAEAVLPAVGAAALRAARAGRRDALASLPLQLRKRTHSGGGSGSTEPSERPSGVELQQQYPPPMHPWTYRFGDATQPLDQQRGGRAPAAPAGRIAASTSSGQRRHVEGAEGAGAASGSRGVSEEQQHPIDARPAPKRQRRLSDLWMCGLDEGSRFEPF